MEGNCGLLVLLVSLALWTCNGTHEPMLIPKPVLAVGGQSQVLDIVCNNGEEPCDTKCFNPATQICHDTYYGSGLACNKNDSICGLECLANNDTSHVCVDDKICLSGQQVCSFLCYDPETEHCLKSKICPIDQAACGYICYNPKNKSLKCHELAYNSYLCKVNDKICGHWGCYDPKTHKCDERQQRICPIDVSICGSECRNEAEDEICVDNKNVCKHGESLCGYQCYNPTNGRVCHADNLVCQPEDESCGTDSCYDPKSGQTCHKIDGSNHMVCGTGLDYCHYNCYDKEEEDCLHPYPDSNYKIVCSKGQTICKATLTSHSDRYGCYNSSLQVCTINDNGQVLRVWHAMSDISGTSSSDASVVVGVFCRCFVLLLLSYVLVLVVRF